MKTIGPCPVHKQYQVKRKPKATCEHCWRLWCRELDLKEVVAEQSEEAKQAEEESWGEELKPSAAIWAGIKRFAAANPAPWEQAQLASLVRAEPIEDVVDDRFIYTMTEAVT